MLTLILMLVAAATAAFFTYSAGEGGHWGWAIPAAIGALLAVSIPINIWVKKRLTQIFNQVQTLLLHSQEVLRRKAGVMQTKGMVGPKAMAQLEKEQTAAVRSAMEPLSEVARYRKWNVLAQKQADLLKGQLLFQIKEYDEARPLLEKAMLINDPLLLCMQMVLHFKQDPAETKQLDKMFNRGVGRFKYERGKLIYALYAWMLVKQNRITEAVTALDEGKNKTEDPVIAQAWENLANRRINRFSFAALGEQWYALGLENPAPVKVRQQPAYGARHAVYR